MSVRSRQLWGRDRIEMSGLSPVKFSRLDAVRVSQRNFDLLFGIHIEVAEAEGIAAIIIGKPAFKQGDNMLPARPQGSIIEWIEAG
ncbi:MAG: hypothetical protein VX220_03650 [Pseudomonadota bacterium]|nr:hypothetical protein [Pseudomonadota bacterium]MED6332127.1 hypothetical protein [Pseudomonadota bacterium]MEE3237972.1 hypothetical protein [Pseudomonadota bacterium]